MNERYLQTDAATRSQDGSYFYIPGILETSIFRSSLVK
jgi:hypothetical protein